MKTSIISINNRGKSVTANSAGKQRAARNQAKSPTKTYRSVEHQNLISSGEQAAIERTAAYDRKQQTANNRNRQRLSPSDIRRHRMSIKASAVSVTSRRAKASALAHGIGISYQ